MRGAEKSADPNGRTACKNRELFRGLRLGQPRDARDGLYGAALAQEVYALETLQYATLFGRCGTSALKTAMLGHKFSPFYKINKRLH